MQTYDISVKIDFSDPEKVELMLTAAREAAATLYTAAMLLKDKRDPQIRLMTGNLIEGNREIAFLAEEQAARDQEARDIAGE